MILPHTPTSFFFFFNDTATTEIYTLSLHDALPICVSPWGLNWSWCYEEWLKYDTSEDSASEDSTSDRKSTRLNSSHSQISYAVFCLKKKNKKNIDNYLQSS